MDVDLYGALGVSKDASESEVRKAYRALARKHHPDLNPGDAAAEERFKQVGAAFDVLGKADKRALYDEFGADAEKIGYDPERADEYRRWQRRAQATADYRGHSAGASPGFAPSDGRHPNQQELEELLASMFGGQANARNLDVQASLDVSFRDAVLGTKTQVELPSTSGEAQRVTLTIPAGVTQGQKLRLSGKGLAGPPGGAPGDLYVRVTIRAHPVFVREGQDLHMTLPITVGEALAGAKVEVPTLDGSLTLTVPARSGSGTRLRLKGKGVASPAGSTGDLYVTLAVTVPAGGDDDARARVAQEIDALYDGDVRAELRKEAAR